MPSGVELTASGGRDLGALEIEGVTVGVVPVAEDLARDAPPPDCTVPLVVRTCTGGAFSSADRTVTVTVADAVPPRPSVIV